MALDRYFVYFLFIVCGLVIHRLWSKSWSQHVLDRRLSACHSVALRQVLFASACLAFYLVGTKDLNISRAFLFTFLPVMYGILFLSHRWIPFKLAKSIFKQDEHRTILIGTHKGARELQDWLKRKEIFGLRTLGLILHSQDNDEPLSDLPVLGSMSNIEDIIQENTITHAIILDSRIGPDISKDLVEICDRMTVRLLLVNDLQESLRHTANYFEDDGVHFISLRAEPLESPWNRFLKRSIDLAVALPIALSILPIVCFIVWLFQRFQSPGPLFHTQWRAGMQNRRFKILKFRTMYPNHGQEELQASKNDCRIYPAGQWLRKFSIDELPQFWNVLEGNMSVVGPRPHLLEHNENFAKIMEKYHVRSLIKPGITGLAQIKGFRGETKTSCDLVRRVEWDIHYLEKWSLGLEWSIILKTFHHLAFPPRTAY
jgi:exopolysaccharide biosynthesis polyprenyl glycosylphosphotransferase